MAPILLHENHKRVLAATLRHVDEAMDQIEQLLTAGHEDAPTPLLTRIVNPLREDQITYLRQQVAVVRRMLASLVHLYDLQPTKELGVPWAIFVTMSHLWEILRDCTSKPLSGYGAVPEESKAVLDTTMEQLIAAVVHIGHYAMGRHENPPNAGASHDESRCD